MADKIESIGNQIESIALALVTLEDEDLPVMGEMLNQLTAIGKQSDGTLPRSFVALVKALEIYLEKVVLRDTEDLKPFETGLEHLQHYFHAIFNEKEFSVDLSAILSDLGDNGNHGELPGDSDTQIEAPGGGPQESPPSCKMTDPGDARRDDPAPEYFGSPDPDMDDEDRDIAIGFVLESLDGLETVEVSLMDLEENPDDPESINAIFRSFHTIKGVSAFLGFMRINKLAHRSENLLEVIRSGELKISARIVDVILESVDALKKLILGVQTGMDNGTSLDIGLDIAPLIRKLETVHGESDSGPPVGRILMERGAIDEEVLKQALQKQAQSPQKKIGELLVEEGSVPSRQVVAALREQKGRKVRQTESQVKVDTRKLDNLVDMTGELVIAHSMLRQHPYMEGATDQRLIHTMGQLNQIASSLQAMTMSLRMVPIKSTFQKMLRLVRDLARNSDKQVRLTMFGEETEIDRNVVDELYEPMVHMIRNSVDHGLETPDERRSAGKPSLGEISLKAFHRGGNIIVEISDDGRGLNRERILRKAKANGLITDETKMNDDDIYNLIFQPGFSTANAVSDLSGRGVGMDVVKKAIEKLRGRVDIITRQGEGSTFVISLPLTLAIIEGMLVRIGSDRYVIPALSIIESFRPTREQYSTVEGRGEMILTRGQLVPLIRLDHYFGCRFDVRHPWEGLVVTVEYDGKNICLLLDELLGKEEVVIKSMGEYVKNVKGIAGGAIMGDGKVGLILDMAGIWQLVNQSE